MGFKKLKLLSMKELKLEIKRTRAIIKMKGMKPYRNSRYVALYNEFMDRGGDLSLVRLNRL